MFTVIFPLVCLCGALLVLYRLRRWVQWISQEVIALREAIAAGRQELTALRVTIAQQREETARLRLTLAEDRDRQQALLDRIARLAELPQREQ